MTTDMSHTLFMDWVSSFKGMKLNASGCSALEKLPNELLTQILKCVALSDTTQKFHDMKDNFPEANPNKKSEESSLFSCLLTSHRLHNIALGLTYQCPKISNFDQFVQVLNQRPDYRPLVRSLDLSQFQRKTTPKDLPTSLSLTPRLKRLSLHLDAFRDPETTSKIFSSFQDLEAIDIQGNFDVEWDEVLSPLNYAGLHPETTYSITSLLLQGIQFGKFLLALLPRCPNLQVLDVQNCYLDHGVLSSLHGDARLTHFILESSQGIDGDELVEFLTKHPAVINSLEVMNLSKVYCYQARPLGREHVTTILDHAPASLRSLNLGGCDMDISHLSRLQELSTQLEELGVGRNLSMRDVEHVLLGSRYDLNQISVKNATAKDKVTNPQLAAMENAVAAVQLRQRVRSLSLKRHHASLPPAPRIRHLALRSMYLDIDDLRSSFLLGLQSLPLRTIELPHMMIADHQELVQFCAAVGWKVKWVGSRIWLERKE
ncbi:hypothetical protein EG329_008870 [Mollisiaceae sp. DMI_Dod_QoI]|nr:hypothetical protein EG329_008870 [Helotiales sp. DMI_Dod_QoI]